MRHMGIVAVIMLSLLVGACAKVDVNGALLKAAEVGNLGKVKALLEKGADPNSTDPFNRTPLMIASFGGHAEVADSLIKGGADIYARAKFGQTAFQFASEQGHAKIVELLKAAQMVNPPKGP